MKELRKLSEKTPEDINLDLDLDEWEYSLTHPEEILEQTRIIYNPKFSSNDLEY
ncbi:hypothetical protein [Methanobrevibacter filiformis]|nr:hypothetical protein [Methanobrevibacter filiformis]